MHDRTNTWSDEETGYLMVNYKTSSNLELATALGKTVSNVQAKMKRLGLTRKETATSLENEIWKEITEITHISYSISNLGRVKNNVTNKIVQSSFDNWKYHQVGLYVETGKKVKYKVHRLVAMYFIPNPNNYEQVNHIDGNKDHNYESNLEWCTPSQNLQHAYDTNLRDSQKYAGSKSHLATIDESVAHQICKLLQEGKTNQYIQQTLSVSSSIVCSIKSRYRWKHVSCNYTWE